MICLIILIFINILYSLNENELNEMKRVFHGRNWICAATRDTLQLREGINEAGTALKGLTECGDACCSFNTLCLHE